MTNNINIINTLIKQLEDLYPISEENLDNLNKKFRLEFNYNSNHIEGNTLTYGETALLLIFDKTEGNHEMREYEEMKAHDVAYKLIQEYAKDPERPLTENFIKELNKIILVRPFWKDAITPNGDETRRRINIGAYKEYPNSVRLANGEMFHYTSPTDTPIAMGDLLVWYNKETENAGTHPIALAALLHYKFVCIHPFDDGNGRVARLLTNYVLLKNNLPPVIIKTADKKDYLFALNQADAGNLNAFVDYISTQLIWSIGLKIKAAKGLPLDEPGDMDKKLSLLKADYGFDKNAKAESSPELIMKFITENIDPLIKLLEDKLQEFDLFFKKRESHIYFSNNIQLGLTNNIYELFTYVINIESFIKKILINGTNAIDFTNSYYGLRESNLQAKIEGTSFSILFYKNILEVNFLNNIILSKSYNQKITSEEMKMIIDKLGNWQIEQIGKLRKEL